MSTYQSQTHMFDVLIKNGRIVDGSGRPSYMGDIAIKGQRIVKIGKTFTWEVVAVTAF